jgi:hypothetical protein
MMWHRTATLMCLSGLISILRAAWWGGIKRGYVRWVVPIMAGRGATGFHGLDQADRAFSGFRRSLAISPFDNGAWTFFAVAASWAAALFAAGVLCPAGGLKGGARRLGKSQSTILFRFLEATRTDMRPGFTGRDGWGRCDQVARDRCSVISSAFIWLSSQFEQPESAAYAASVVSESACENTVVAS